MKKILVIVLLLAGAIAVFETRDRAQKQDGERTAEKTDEPSIGGTSDAWQEYPTFTDASGRKMVEVRLNPMIELDFLKKAEIYGLRKKYVAAYPAFAPKKYEPSDAVFGQIVDGKSWWGILGLSYYGNGERSIEGPSEESRFIANPYLLVGLDEGCCYKNEPILKFADPKSVYPAPQKLAWNVEGTYGEVTYDMTQYLADAVTYLHSGLLKNKQLDFIAYNARDLGFGYCQADASASQNIAFHGLDQRAIGIPQFIHLGGSSQYPGGSNNMSPHVPELVFNYQRLPARAVFKMWRKPPENSGQKPDFVFVVNMTGTEPPIY